MRATVLAACASVALLVNARDAAAQCVQGATGEAIRGCRLHIVTGPVLAPSRVLGLGGAYQGIAEGLEGFAVNSAAPAVRQAWSWRWFDYDADASISVPSLFRRVDDLEFDGVKENFNYSGFIFLTLGANVQLGPWGFGVVSDLQRFDLSTSDDASYRAQLMRNRVLVGRSLFDGDLVVGAGVRHTSFDVTGTVGGEARRLVSIAGLAPEAGFVVRPEDHNFRLGATFRLPVSTGESGAGDATRVDRWWIPESVHLPWELDLGAAFAGGKRPLNVHWNNPKLDEEHFLDDIRRARDRRELERRATLAAVVPELRAQRRRELMRDEERIRKDEEREIREFDRRYARRARERYARLSREQILFSLGLLIVGPTERGISLESFFTQEVTRAGAVTTLSPRAGVETELVPNLFRPRIGTYVEPSRFTLSPDWKAFRQHVTAGFDLYLFRWRVLGLFEEGTAWRVTMAIDVTHNYWNYGLSIGIWR